MSRIRDSCLCPETQREVTDELGFPVRDWGYRLSDQVLDCERAE
ncbi:MAG: hypothetical protein P8R42_10190 [Candidatus Binatia bacterium]|nr:hypothetical protein [Candidatus Binatia bacterium]